MNTTITYFHPQRTPGLTRVIDGFTVEYIRPVPGTCVDIEYFKYTADLSAHSTRAFKVLATGIRYATLEAAARAIIKARCTQPVAA